MNVTMALVTFVGVAEQILFVILNVNFFLQAKGQRKAGNLYSYTSAGVDIWDWSSSIGYGLSPAELWLCKSNEAYSVKQQNLIL